MIHSPLTIPGPGPSAADGAISAQLRLQRLFSPASGRGIMVAVDHGIEGVPRGLERVQQTIQSLLPLGIEAFLLNPGMFRHVAGLFRGPHRPGVILAVDLYINSPRPRGTPQGDAHVLIASVEQAVALGADAIKAVLVFGQSDYRAYADNVATVARVIDQAHRYGMPVMLETVVWGQALPRDEWATPEFIGHMMRIGVELGADVLKVPYADPVDEFAALVSACPVPVTVLGGSHAEEDAVVAAAARALQAGARGLVFGRNIWQQRAPAGIVRRLQAVVHAGSEPGR
ncbi:MAG: hypothetical protein LOD91_04135 [Limnochordales bacterium]